MIHAGHSNAQRAHDLAPSTVAVSMDDAAAAVRRFQTERETPVDAAVESDTAPRQRVDRRECLVVLGASWSDVKQQVPRYVRRTMRRSRDAARRADR